MKRVIVSVTNNLVTDQRVERVCQSLHNWGFEVLLVGREWPQIPISSRDYSCKLIKNLFNRKFFFYAEYNIRLFFFLLFRKTDILLANDLDTLPANYFAAKIKRCKLIFDSHEYFSETPEVYQRRFVRNFWLFIEKMMIGACDNYYTVSGKLAEIYMNRYGIKFNVIRNLPVFQPWSIGGSSGKIIIYQGSVNVGRGLELMLRALKLLPDANLVIAGDGPELWKLKEMASSLQLTGRVRFTGNLLPFKLKELTKTASVGISIEEAMGKSYFVALPNKLFDYIQAGIPVLTSNLPEMAAVVKQYEVGMILEERTPENLASVLDYMLSNEEKRLYWREKTAIARQELCWEKEEIKLKELFKI